MNTAQPNRSAILTEARKLDRRCACRICGAPFTVSAPALVDEHMINLECTDEAVTLGDTLNAVECCPKCDGR